MSTTLRLSRRARVLPVTVTRPPRRDPRVAIYPNTIFTKITSAFSTTSGTAFGGSARVSQRRARAATKKKKTRVGKKTGGNLNDVFLSSRGSRGGGRPEERRTPSRDRRSHARAPARRPRAPTRRTSHVLRRRYQPDELPPRTRRADVPARQRALPQTALLQEALLVQDRERVEREQHGLAKRPQGHRASGGRGRGAGSGSGCLRGVRCGANGWSFFRLIDDARVFARCQLPQPNLPRGPSFWAFLAKPTRGVGSRYCLLKVRSKLCLSAFESQTFRVHRDGRSALRVFGENKPPFWSQTAPRGAAGQTVLPRGSCVLLS